MSNIKSILNTVAPWIGAAVSGGVPALVGMAAVEIGNAVGVRVDPNPTAINAAISNATPDQLKAIKDSEADFQLRLQDLGFTHIESLEAIASADRADARKRQIELNDITPTIISYSVIICFAIVLYGLLVREVKVDPQLRDVVMVLIGTLAASYTQVLNFYLGASSTGNKTKPPTSNK